MSIFRRLRGRTAWMVQTRKTMTRSIRARNCNAVTRMRRHNLWAKDRAPTNQVSIISSRRVRDKINVLLFIISDLLIFVLQRSFYQWGWYFRKFKLMEHLSMMMVRTYRYCSATISCTPSEWPLTLSSTVQVRVLSCVLHGVPCQTLMNANTT